MSYNKVTDEIISFLGKIVDRTNIILEKEVLENYAHDETPLYKSMPEVVVKPMSTQQVSEVMKIANVNMIPVTPRSGGTSLSAGAVPIKGGIVLSLENMNKIKELDKENMMVIVEPGIITEQLEIELAKQGLFFPPDPISLDSCMIGGNIAECAGGPRAMKYGVTKNYVLGIEVVLADGTVQTYGGKLLKNVTGYDMIDLIIGSEGTLAIITEATLKVLPLPAVIIDLLIPFKCVEDSVSFAIDVMQSGIMPAAIEFMEGDVYRMVAKYLKRKLPFAEADGHVIVELDGDNKDVLSKHYDQIGNIALKNGALDVFVGESVKDKEKIWEPRRKTSDALKDQVKPLAREDLVVPKNKIPELIAQLKQYVAQYGANLYAFGHLGDGNIHADVGLTDSGNKKTSGSEKAIKNVTELDRIEKMRRGIYEITLSLGGTITAEHGIGLSKIKYLEMALDPRQILIMRGIKKIFDPKNILNPGKVLLDS
jgi:glycolate oxidase